MAEDPERSTGASLLGLAGSAVLSFVGEVGLAGRRPGDRDIPGSSGENLSRGNPATGFGLVVAAEARDGGSLLAAFGVTDVTGVAFEPAFAAGTEIGGNVCTALGGVAG